MKEDRHGGRYSDIGADGEGGHEEEPVADVVHRVAEHHPSRVYVRVLVPTRPFVMVMGIRYELYDESDRYGSSHCE